MRHERKEHSVVATLAPTVAVEEAMLEVIVEEVSPEAVVVVSGVAVADAKEPAGWFRVEVTRACGGADKSEMRIRALVVTTVRTAALETD